MWNQVQHAYNQSSNNFTALATSKIWNNSDLTWSPNWMKGSSTVITSWKHLKRPWRWNQVVKGSGSFGDPLGIETGHAVEQGLTETGVSMLQNWLGTGILVLCVPGPVSKNNTISASVEIIIFCIFIVYCGKDVLCILLQNVRVTLTVRIVVTRFFGIIVLLCFLSSDCYRFNSYCFNFLIGNSGPFSSLCSLIPSASYALFPTTSFSSLFWSLQVWTKLLPM